MTRTRFIYHGPVSSAPIGEEGGEPEHVPLHPGEPVNLPAEHTHVLGLVALGLLTLAPAEDAPPARSSRPRRAPAGDSDTTDSQGGA